MYSETATHQTATLSDPRPLLRLTIRPFNHNFTAADFEAYECSRRYLFRDPRIARAALLAGGILWRLAIEDVALDVALIGPEPLFSQLGFGFRIQDEKGDVYVDDGLTHIEMCNIVGMYFEQPAHDRVKWDNDTYPMWWPLPCYLKDHALDFPTWTPVNDDWYIRLRTKYREGQDKPKQGIQWRSSLRNFDKRARQLTQHSREMTDIALRRILCS